MHRSRESTGPNPLVTAIIAVYNGEASIRRAIDSVLNQDFTDFELLVINDASRDSTSRILRSYGDRIRVISRLRNRGLAEARNLAVRRAKGRYVAFLDADDVWLPDRLGKTLSALQSSKTASLAFSDVVPVDENYAPLAPSYLHPGMARAPTMENLLDEGWWPILPSTVIIHRWAFKRAGGFGKGFRGASGFEDTEFWFLLREFTDFVFVPEPLVQYRLAPFLERMRKYAPGFRLFARHLRRRYGVRGDHAVRRCAALYRWLLTVKGLRSVQAGDMKHARQALFCVLRYQADVRLQDRLSELMPADAVNLEEIDSANVAAQASEQANGTEEPDPERWNNLRRAYYSLLPQRQALALMSRAGLLEIPPPPPSHEGFAKEFLAGGEPLALR